VTPDQYSALLNEVLESNAIAKKNANELVRLRGEVVKLDGSVTNLRGEIILLGAEVQVNGEDIAKVNDTLKAIMQTVDGMNHLAKSAFDMASANVVSIRGLEQFVGKPLIDEQQEAATSAEAGTSGGAAE
jgi:hypothetical protein